MIDLNTPMIEIDRPTAADDVCKCIAAIALSCVGLTGRQATRERFGRQIGPRDAPESDRPANEASRRSIVEWLKKPFGAGGPSTCGMVGESFHAQLGADAPTLYRPYVAGTAVSRAVAYLQVMKAWHDAMHQADLEPRPQLAAYVVIGCTKPKGWTQSWDWGGIEHAFRIVSRDLDADVFQSVDGGSVDGKTGLQCVKAVTRRWTIIRGHAWLVDPVKGTGRRVLGWGDPALLAFRPGLPMIVPEGWEGVDTDG